MTVFQQICGPSGKFVSTLHIYYDNYNVILILYSLIDSFFQLYYISNYIYISKSGHKKYYI